MGDQMWDVCKGSNPLMVSVWRHDIIAINVARIIVIIDSVSNLNDFTLKFELKS